MAYTQQTWHDEPTEDTPLSADRFTHIEQGIGDAAATADSAVQPGDLADVATSGAYSDLTGTPTLGTAAAHAATDFDTAGAAADAQTAAESYTDTNAVAVTASPSGDPGTPVWTRRLASSIATTWSNLRETYVNSVLKSWLNEWGALRGTSPYSWGDALVRAVLDDTISDTTTNSAVEVVDRRTGSDSETLWGVGWDGVVRIGGTADNLTGSATVAAVLVDNGADAPAGLPDGTLIFELPA